MFPSSNCSQTLPTSLPIQPYVLTLSEKQKKNQNKYKTNMTKKNAKIKPKKNMEFIMFLIFLNACFIFIKGPVEICKV